MCIIIIYVPILLNLINRFKNLDFRILIKILRMDQKLNYKHNSVYITYRYIEINARLNLIKLKKINLINI